MINFKRLTAMVLSALLILSMLSVPASAESISVSGTTIYIHDANDTIIYNRTGADSNYSEPLDLTNGHPFPYDPTLSYDSAWYESEGAFRTGGEREIVFKIQPENSGAYKFELKFHPELSGWTTGTTATSGTFKVTVNDEEVCNEPMYAERTDGNYYLTRNHDTITYSTVDTSDDIQTSMEWVAPLNGGQENIMRVRYIASSGGYNLWFDKLDINKLPAAAFTNAAKIRAGGTVSSGGTVAKGTDRLELLFNGPMAADENMVLTLSNGTGTLSAPVATVNSNSSNSLFVHFTEALEDSTDYTLSWSGVKDAYSSNVTDGSFSFSTDASSNGDAPEVTVIPGDCTITDNRVHIKAYMQSADGIGIKGRAYTIQLCDSVGSPVGGVSIPGGISGVNGLFEADYEFADDPNGVSDNSGLYVFKLGGEYIAAGYETDVPLNFLSKKDKGIILGQLETAGTPEAVYNIFNTYKTELGINPPSTFAGDGANTGTDLAKIASPSLFYAHFVNSEYNDVIAFNNDYNKYKYLEQINQFTVESDIESVLNNGTAMGLLGITADKLVLLDAEKNNFLTALKNADLGTPATTEKLDDVYNKLLEYYLVIDSDLVVPALSISIPSVNLGQEFELTSTLSALTSDIEKIKITIDEASKTLSADNMTVSAGADAVITKAAESGNLVINIEYRNPAAVTAIGVIKFASPFTDAGTANFTVSAEITYSAQTNGYVPKLLITDNASAGVSIPQDSYQPTGSSKYTASGYSSTGSSGGSTGGNSGTSEPVVENKPFNDLDDVSWAEESILMLYKKNIISGYEGKFNPHNNVTRAEFAKMVVNALGLSDYDGDIIFADVPADHWSYPFVAGAAKYGLIMGDNGMFRGNDFITREDMCVIMYRAWLKRHENEAVQNGEDFADAAQISGYAKEAVAAMRAAGIVNGMGENQFMPGDNATRAMAAQIVARFMEEMNL